MHDIKKAFTVALKALFLIIPRGSKKVLAEKMDLSTGHFSDILQGRRGTSEEQRRQLCYLIRDNYLADSDFHYRDMLAYGQAIIDQHSSVEVATQALEKNLKTDGASLKNEWHEFLDTYGDENVEGSYRFLDYFTERKTTLADSQRPEHVPGFKITSTLHPSQYPLVKAPPLRTVADDELESDFLRVPFRDDMRVAAGSGEVPEGFYEVENSPVVIHRNALRRHNGVNLTAFRVGGDSMEPTLMRNGIVVADLAQNEWSTLKERDIYLIWLDDATAVKRLEWAKKGKVLAIISDNPDCKTIYRDVDEIRLFGRIIWSWSEY